MKTILRSVDILIILFFVFAFAPGNARAAWLIDTVDAGKFFSAGTMRLDATGHPHLVYGGDHLYHNYFDGSTWHEEMLDSAPGVGESTRFSIDASGALHIIYEDYIKANQSGYASDVNIYRYATNAGGTWQNQAIIFNPALSAWSGVGMFIDASGIVHLIYAYGEWAEGYDLYYVSGTFGNWTTPVMVVEDVGYYHGGLDNSGNFHLFYQSGYDLLYRTCTSGTWSGSQIVEDNIAESREPSIADYAIDADGYLHLLYKIWPDMRYATNRSGTWQTETVEGVWNGGCSGKISTDASGQVHIAYGGNNDCRNLRYAAGNFGAWDIETVDDLSPDGRFNLRGLSIHMETDGTCHLIYEDSYTADLKHAENSGSGWSVEIIENNAQYPSAEIDAAGQMHLSYYGIDTGAVIYAAENSDWIPQTIVSGSADLGSMVSATTDLSGNTHMVYADRAKNLLKYASGQYGQWVVETIIDTAETSWPRSDPNLAVDSAGNAHMLYFDSNNAIKYATNQSGSFYPYMQFNEDAYFSPFAVDADDHMVFVLLDLTNARLRIMTLSVGSYNIDVENLSGMGDFKADAAGALHLIYSVRGSGNEILFHCTNASGDWLTQEIGGVGSSNDVDGVCLSFDSSNHPHIAFDVDDAAVGYATNVSGDWVITADVVANAEAEAIDVNADGQVTIVWLNSQDWQTFGCAVGNGGTWTNEVIDQTDTYFEHINVDHDDSGTLHISYCDGFSEIKHAQGAPGYWDIETIENTIAYSWNDITVDFFGDVHIAYREFGNRNLKYATTSFSGSEDNVLEFPAYDGTSQMILESPEGTCLESVEPVENPSPINTPDGVEFPYGFVRFAVTDIEPGESIVVTLTLEPGADVNTYWKYGSTPDNPEPHWYEFLYDGTTGAVFSGNIITLHLVDGLRGDSDLTANGTILEPGAPGIGAIPGDLDDDGDVDGNDRVILITSLRKCSGDPAYNVNADYDNDGCVTFADYRQWYIYYKAFVAGLPG